MLLQCFIIVISGDTLYHDVKDDSVHIMCVSLASVSMNCWCLLVSMDFVSQEHGVPHDGPKDSNAGG
jgi:hypothetical protein